MKLYHLIKKMKESWEIQLGLCLLPCVSIIFFVFAYMTDLSKVYYSLDYNNKIVAKGIESNTLMEVSESNLNDDGTFNVLVSSRGIKDIDTYYECQILRVYLLDDLFFKAVIYDDNKTEVFVESFDFIKVKDRNTIEVNGKELKFNGDNSKSIFDVNILKDGFQVVFNDKDKTEIILEEFANVRYISQNEETVKVSYSYDYDIQLKSKSVNFCNNLPTDAIYYDKANYGLVSNISDDLAWNFIVGSKIILVCFCVGVLIILLAILRKQKDLVILSRKEPLVINMVAFLMLPLLTIITILLLN